jgi:hypothetical protein
LALVTLNASVPFSYRSEPVEKLETGYIIRVAKWLMATGIEHGYWG